MSTPTGVDVEGEGEEGHEGAVPPRKLEARAGHGPGGASSLDSHGTWKGLSAVLPSSPDDDEVYLEDERMCEGKAAEGSETASGLFRAHCIGGVLHGDRVHRVFDDQKLLRVALFALTSATKEDVALFLEEGRKEAEYVEALDKLSQAAGEGYMFDGLGGAEEGGGLDSREEGSDAELRRRGEGAAGGGRRRDVESSRGTRVGAAGGGGRRDVESSRGTRVEESTVVEILGRAVVARVSMAREALSRTPGRVTVSHDSVKLHMEGSDKYGLRLLEFALDESPVAARLFSSILSISVCFPPCTIPTPFVSFIPSPTNLTVDPLQVFVSVWKLPKAAVEYASVEARELGEQGSEVCEAVFGKGVGTVSRVLAARRDTGLDISLTVIRVLACGDVRRWRIAWGRAVGRALAHTTDMVFYTAAPFVYPAGGCPAVMIAFSWTKEVAAIMADVVGRGLRSLYPKGVSDAKSFRYVLLPGDGYRNDGSWDAIRFGVESYQMPDERVLRTLAAKYRNI